MSETIKTGTMTAMAGVAYQIPHLVKIQEKNGRIHYFNPNKICHCGILYQDTADLDQAWINFGDGENDLWLRRDAPGVFKFIENYIDRIAHEWTGFAE